MSLQGNKRFDVELDYYIKSYSKRTFDYSLMTEQVDPRPFYDNCVRDSCACDTGGDCECFCTAVAAYAQACNEAGVCVAWRSPDICRKSPPI